MSRIQPIDTSAAPAQVQALLEDVHRGLGMTPNLFRVAAQSPAALEAMVAFFGATARGRLSAATREAIALAVSEANACDYCLSAHSALGQAAGLDEQARGQARRGESEDRHRSAVLRLARAIVDRRGRVGRALDEARGEGLSDGEIVEVTSNVALTIFTNYLNELAGTDIDFPIVRHEPR